MRLKSVLSWRRHPLQLAASVFVPAAIAAVVTMLWLGPAPERALAGEWLINGTLHDNYVSPCSDSHDSVVRYWKESQNPFSVMVDYVQFGGRAPTPGIFVWMPGWKHLSTEYKRWNGSSWVLVKSEGASAGLTTPNNCSPLVWYAWNDNLWLTDGALVKNKLMAYWLVAEFGQIATLDSGWNYHYLE